MKKLSLGLGVSLVVAGAVLASFRYGKEDTVSPLSFLYPHHVTISWETDPRYSQAVTWRTSDTVRYSYVEYCEAAPTPFFQERVQHLRAQTEIHTADDGVWNHHHVNISGLQPGTLYSYRVGTGNYWSEWAEFRTASGKSEPFSFIYLGDVQRDIQSLGSRTIRKAVLDNPDAKFLLFGGDLVHRGALNNENWNEFFPAGGWVFRNYPVLATPGNHEYATARSPDSLTRHWRLNFTFPQNGPPGQEEETYYVDYNNVRIISLNLCRYSIDKKGTKEMLEWLEARLKEFQGDWVIVTHHYSMEQLARNRQPGIRFPEFKTLYERYNVPLVLTGHEHVYARGRIDGRLPVYVVSVSGPYQNAIRFPEWIERSGTSLQMYQEIHISPASIHYVSKTVLGEIYDEFTISKGKKGGLKFVPNRKLVPESLVPPPDFEKRYKRELVDTYIADREIYLQRKK